MPIRSKQQTGTKDAHARTQLRRQKKKKKARELRQKEGRKGTEKLYRTEHSLHSGLKAAACGLPPSKWQKHVFAYANLPRTRQQRPLSLSLSPPSLPHLRLLFSRASIFPSSRIDDVRHPLFTPRNLHAVCAASHGAPARTLFILYFTQRWTTADATSHPSQSRVAN